MKILAIDTSSKICSVSILENEQVILEKRNDDEKTHSQKLMPLVDEIFRETNLTLDQIDMLACCLGPGSFTGVRIGISTMKAFADVKEIPCVGVTSLEGLAHNVLEENVCSVIDAKHENVYIGLYQLTDENQYKMCFEKALDLESAIEELKKYNLNQITFIGDGAVTYFDKIVQSFENCRIVADELNESSSVSIAKAAYTKYQKGEFGSSKDLNPVYLKKSQAERHLDGEP